MFPATIRAHGHRVIAQPGVPAMQKVLPYTALTLGTTAPLLLHAQTPTPPPNPGLTELALLPDAPLPFGPPLQGAAAAAIMANPCALRPGPGSAAPNTAPGCEPTSAPSYRRYLDTAAPMQLTTAGKGLLAIHEFRDPGNIATILGTSAATAGLNAHTAYGPGWNGFGRAVRYTASQDATAEFFGTFLIPSVTHQDPRYRRIPYATVPRRAFHALGASVVAQNDTGARLPNYANL